MGMASAEINKTLVKLDQRYRMTAPFDERVCRSIFQKVVARNVLHESRGGSDSEDLYVVKDSETGSYRIPQTPSLIAFLSETKSVPNLEELQRRLESGERVNTVCPLGQTPLRLAAERGLVEHVHLLLLYGADPYQKNLWGKNILEYCTVRELDTGTCALEHDLATTLFFTPEISQLLRAFSLRNLSLFKSE